MNNEIPTKETLLKPESNTKVVEVPLEDLAKQFKVGEAPAVNKEDVTPDLDEMAELEELLRDYPSQENQLIPSQTIVDDINIQDPAVAKALSYVGNSKDVSYVGRLRAWKNKKEFNNDGLKKYKWGTVALGGGTLAAGVGVSALGYTAAGIGLGFGAPVAMLGGGAVWGGKKLYNHWKEKKAAKALNLHPEDTYFS